MKPTSKEKAQYPHLISYNSNILGIKLAKVNPMHGKNKLIGHSTLFDILNEIIINPEPMPEWNAALPTRSD